MKTAKHASWLKFLSYGAVGLFLSLNSCKDNAIDFTSSDSQNVENEATTDSYYQDADDMTGLAISIPDETKGGKIAGQESGRNFPILIDIRFACATVSIVSSANSTPTNPVGTITIDFGTGCTDARQNVRKGKIIINYMGRRFLAGSTVITTFDGYYINGIKLEGTRTVTNITASTEAAPKFSVSLVGGKATWPDATFATREASRTVEWTRATNPIQDQLTVSGTATGTNRNGRIYTMTIANPLVYKRECALSDRVFMAVQGTKELTVDGKKVTVDYGAGDCDRKVTVTINGKSAEVTVRGDI